MSDKTSEERARGHSIRVCLPRPQRPLPPRQRADGRFESLGAIVANAWMEDERVPSHALIRYSLSVGMPLEAFLERFRKLQNIKYAFGFRVFVHPVRVDHHEIELADFDHLAEPDTGEHEIEVRWRKKRCGGGSHMVFAVAAAASGSLAEHAAELHALDALEALIRVALGATTVVQSRQTMHVDLRSGLVQVLDPGNQFSAYGAAELPRSDEDSIGYAVELATASAKLPVELQGRLSLGMRWANMAFASHDLLMFWTALEILAAAHGRRVYNALANAYGLRSHEAQVFAKTLGLDKIYHLRCELAHNGLPVSIRPEGASYLNALVHDLARHLASLSCLRHAQRVLDGRDIDQWFGTQALSALVTPRP